jgi:hypothetical protein
MVVERRERDGGAPGVSGARGRERESARLLEVRLLLGVCARREWVVWFACGSMMLMMMMMMMVKLLMVDG